MVTAASKINDTRVELANCRSAADVDRLQRKLRAAWDRLNDAVFDLYELSAEDRLLVRNRLDKSPVVALTAD